MKKTLHGAELVPLPQLLIAIDPSTTRTGIAVFSGAPPNKSVFFRRAVAHEIRQRVPTRERIIEMANWIGEFVDQYHPDDLLSYAIVRELPYLGHDNPKTALTLGRLWGAVDQRLAKLKIHDVEPASWQLPVLGLPADSDREARGRMAQLYAEDIAGDKLGPDEASAVCLGVYYVQFVMGGPPVRKGLPRA